MVAFNKNATIGGKVLKDANDDPIKSEAFEKDGSERQRSAAKRAGEEEKLSDFVREIDKANGDLD